MFRLIFYFTLLILRIIFDGDILSVFKSILWAKNVKEASLIEDLKHRCKAALKIQDFSL